MKLRLEGASEGLVIKRGLRQGRGVRLGRRVGVISREMVERGKMRSAMEVRR